jgi:hypothetical protein
VTNTGNTAHSYRIALYGQNTNATPLQVIITKNSTTPRAAGCTLQSVPQSLSLARADAAPVTTSLSSASNPNIPDGAETNATVAMAPGETVFVTLRGQLPKDQMAALVQQLTPVVTAHGTNTNGVSPDFALLLSIQTTGNGLPGALVGVPYSVTLQSTGGKTPITWTLVSGTLPTGLSLSSAGVISGTPTGTGTFTFTVQAADSSATPQKVTQTLNLVVDKRSTTTAVSLSPTSVLATGGSVATATVTDTEPTGTASAPSGSVTISGDGGVTGGTCTLAPTGASQAACTVTVTAPSSGADTITGVYGGSTVHKTSTSTAVLNVTSISTSTGISASMTTAMVGQTVTITVSVAATSPGATSPPTGTVSFGSSVSTDVFTPGSTCSLSPTGGVTAGCSVTFTAASASPHTVTATYGGVSGVLQGSSASVVLTINPVPYTFTGFLSPLSPAGTLTAPSNSGTGNFTKGVPLKWQLKDSSGNFLSNLTTTQKLSATYYGTICGTGQATGATSILYLPTSGATGNSTFRYDTSNNQFLFNWATKQLSTGAGCYEVVLQLNDGSAPKATKILLQ